MPIRRNRERKRHEGTIPTDSFSDIAFLLIIYFLVATTLVKVKSISADLPAGEKSTSAQTDKTPTVNLRGGEIFFNDKPLDLEGLKARLAALELARLEPEKRVVLLESAAGTPYQNYFQAMAAISASGGVVAIVEDDKKK